MIKDSVQENGFRAGGSLYQNLDGQLLHMYLWQFFPPKYRIKKCPPSQPTSTGLIVPCTFHLDRALTPSSCHDEIFRLTLFCPSSWHEQGKTQLPDIKISPFHLPVHSASQPARQPTSPSLPAGPVDGRRHLPPNVTVLKKGQTWSRRHDIEII